jgi:indolepyruvate ferredoxin oxidoreductase beta subunit
MKTNLILSGVGGQGILTIAAILDTAALQQNLYVKQSEVHGMSQRGGAVQSHVRISNSEVYSDLIPEGKADMVLSVEPLEALRYIPFLKKDGWIITDTHPFRNILDYPEESVIMKEIKKHPNHIIINATEEAKKLGNSKVANIILLGAATSLISLSDESIVEAIKTLFQTKSEKLVALNLEAYQLGKELAKSNDNGTLNS